MQRNPVRIINTKKEYLDMNLIFSFSCKYNGKNYVAINNNDTIFEFNSRYANLDIYEIVQEKSNAIIVSDVNSSDWDSVKKSLQFDVFSKMNQQ